MTQEMYSQIGLLRTQDPVWYARSNTYFQFLNNIHIFLYIILPTCISNKKNWKLLFKYTYQIGPEMKHPLTDKEILGNPELFDAHLQDIDKEIAKTSHTGALARM